MECVDLNKRLKIWPETFNALSFIHDFFSIKVWKLFHTIEQSTCFDLSLYNIEIRIIEKNFYSLLLHRCSFENFAFKKNINAFNKIAWKIIFTELPKGYIFYAWARLMPQICWKVLRQKRTVLMKRIKRRWPFNTIYNKKCSSGKNVVPLRSFRFGYDSLVICIRCIQL